MEKVNNFEFADEIFEEMQKFDIGMSLSNAKFDYKSIYGEEVSKDYIKALLMRDKRFIFLNNSYFLVNKTLNAIKEKYEEDITEIWKGNTWNIKVMPGKGCTYMLFLGGYIKPLEDSDISSSSSSIYTSS